MLSCVATRASRAKSSNALIVRARKGAQIVVPSHSVAKYSSTLYTRRNTLSAPLARVAVTQQAQLPRRAFANEKYPPHTVLKMPALSPTMTKGNIAKWKKKEGDKVSAGDVLCEIETDKATVSLEAQDDGFLARVLVKDGTQDVELGTAIAVLVDSKGSVGKFANFSALEKPSASPSAPAASASPASPAPSAAAKPAAAAPSSSTPAKNYPPHTKLPMPALSPTMTTGTIASWKRKEGDKISAGDVLCEIETDKATVSLEAQDEGYLAKIVLPAKTADIAIGKVIAILVDDKKLVSQFADFREEATPSAASKPSAAPSSAASPSPPAPQQQASAAAVEISESDLSPAVLHLVHTHNIDPSSVKGTGPKGRLLKGDILSAIDNGTAKKQQQKAKKESAPAAPSPSSSTAAAAPSPSSRTGAASYEDIPNNNIRKVVAKRLSESKSQIPHVYLSQDFEIDRLMKMRASFNDTLKAGGSSAKVSVNDFLIKAAALALREIPAANAQWTQNAVRRMKSVDISVAVATPRGLITPIVKNADQRGLANISTTVKDLADRARDNKLKPEEFMGGTFSISNLGMFGIREFSAVINPPQAAILAVGSGRKLVQQGTDGKLKAVTVMNCTLSADGRVIDEDVAAQFMDSLRKYLTEPTNMIL